MTTLEIILNKIDRVDNERAAWYGEYLKTGNLNYKARAEAAKERLTLLEKSATAIRIAELRNAR